MSTITSIIAIISSFVYFILLAFTLRNAQRVRGAYLWLTPVVLLALLANIFHLFPESAQTASLSVFFYSAMLVAFGALTLIYLNRSGMRWWLSAGTGWLVLLVVADFFNEASLLGQRGWLGQIFSPENLAGLVALLGWVISGAVLLALAFHAFYTAHLPEVANQALFWAIVIPSLLVGVALGSSGSLLLAEVGWIVGACGVFGAVYGVASHRVFDIRRALRQSLGVLVMTLITAAVILVAMSVAQTLTPDDGWNLIVLGALALVVAAIYVPLRQLAEAVVRNLFTDTAVLPHALRQYSQQISMMIELEAVVRLATQTLVSVLRARPGGLMLATTDEKGHMWVEPMVLLQGNGGALPDVRGEIDSGSAIYRTLFIEQMPLLQFDIEFGREYAEIDSATQNFWKQLRMSAYAPILADGQPIGILASGPKHNDQPFDSTELEVLATVAYHTGIALRNARLVTDLRHLNEEMEAANEHLARLDSVKTDFITVASHELRTPLAQIRGYTDIIEGLNEQDILDPAQMVDFTRNLRSASERMEELISAMLDVSKIDVNAMDLRFAQATMESVMRLAIEPLTEAILARKLTLSAKGLRGLPAVEADMKRLVQAFRNVVSNAVKYTPDGGLINIRAWLEERDERPDEIFIEVTDSGVGIDPANLELIFEKFFRVADPGLHSTGSTKFMGAGPGLGLTIARGVIEGHGGQIWVESAGYDPDQCPGSTFHIVLPISPPADAKRILPFEETTVSATAAERAQLQEAASEAADGSSA